MPEGWTAPPKSDPPEAKPHEWVVDVEPRSNFDSGVRIYEMPPYVSGLDRKVRLVASCEREEDARLIVALHETHRQTALRQVSQ